MVFRVQVIRENKSVKQARVQMSVTELCGGMHRMNHIGEGWYECESGIEADFAKVFVNSESYGFRPSSDIISLA